ncbi:MAG TPA: hypothetical protein VLM75_10215 [Spirochaetota bacterium]|nr:hypothetical protein [Spirochaetota bacterium]
MRVIRTAAAVCAVLTISAGPYSDDLRSQATPALLADEFYTRLQAAPVIRRDFFLDAHLNKIMVGRGRVIAVDTAGRYKRRYRIMLAGLAVSPKITFYVYADGDDYRTLLSAGDLFEFKGQFVVYTPVNSSRDAYIFDIVMEEGAVVVEEGR